MRSGEDLGSAVLAELAAGEQCIAVKHGATNQLMVRHVATGQEGWISRLTSAGQCAVDMVPAKVWNFLLPATGSHQLRVENIGAAGQRVIVDGDAQSARQSLIFEGPDNSLLELRPGQGQWSLRVNGLIVEDYTAKKRQSQDETLRELRTKPEGSYLISTEFDASSLDLNLVRMFRFIAEGREHEVRVAHMDCIWQVLCDGKLVERLAHKMRDNNGEARFDVTTASGRKLKAVVAMQWQHRAMVWRYNLNVNGVEVVQCWTQANGDDEAGHPKVVCEGHGTPAELPEDYEPPEAEEVERQPAIRELPQGVSFDAVSGSYQANIRARTGKFIFLGEFRTPEEAHLKYLQAVPIHCPDKAIVPGVPK